MTSFTINAGGTVYFDQQTGGSTNATLDTYTIVNNTTFMVRTDTYACPNHSAAFGSLDNVRFGTGKVKFDPTYTRYVAHTSGSGTVPAYGTTISQGGVSGVFLGVWADWQSDPVVPGGTVPTSGYIKLGGITGGSFAAGALTGITATCSGADAQSWIEVLMPNGATIETKRLGSAEGPDSDIWFELGTTNGSAGQVIPCPTTATAAGIFPAVWIETGVGTGVYEVYYGVGSRPATSTTRTDASCKCIWQTTSGIRIGNDGTNNVGYLPPSGCKVRIPAVILSCCVRTSGFGSGPRVVPNTAASTRARFDTAFGGEVRLRTVSSSVYIAADKAYALSLINVSTLQAVYINAVRNNVTIQGLVITPNQTSGNTPFNMENCNGITTTIEDVMAIGYSASTGIGAFKLSNCSGMELVRVTSGSAVARATATYYALWLDGCNSIELTSPTLYGGWAYINACATTTINNITYYDSLTTTASSATYQGAAVKFLSCSELNMVEGVIIPIANQGPYRQLVIGEKSSGIKVRNIGTFDSPVVLDATVTSGIFGTDGGVSNSQIARCYVSNPRGNVYSMSNTDTNITFQNIGNAYSATGQLASNNSIVKGAGQLGSSTVQLNVLGNHWEWRYTGATTGTIQMRFNDVTTASASQVTIVNGSNLFDGSGSVLLTALNNQVVWETPDWVLGFTAFTNSLPSVSGANTTSAGNGVWGNHLIEYQINTGSGYSAWKNLTGANLSGESITASDGFKLKVRITCQTAASNNSVTNLQIAMDTTSAAQRDSLYPLDVITLTINGLVSGSDVIIYAAGTTTVRQTFDAISGTSAAYTYESTENIDIGVFKAGYKVKYVLNYALTASDATIPITQEADRNYA